MIRAVVFDLDDTLYDYESLDREAMENLCSFTRGRLGITREAFFDAFKRARKETKETLEGTGASHNRMLYCQKTLEELGKKPASLALEMYEAYWGYMLERMELRAGARELFRYCREKGIKIGICTDLTAHIQHRKLRALGLEAWTDVLVTSEEAGAEKPSPAIYRLLLDKLRMSPEEVLFVGDSLERDVKGPAAMGMRAVLFHGGEMSEEAHRQAVRGEYAQAGMMEDIKEIIDAG